MFFQLIAEAASLTVTCEGRPYIFTKGEPVKVDNRDIKELRKRTDIEECPEEGLAPKTAKELQPQSIVSFSGPSDEPRPKPAPHEPTPPELAKARRSL